MSFQDLRVVLVEPEQPRNVGSAIRAAANFGLSTITVVRASGPLSPEEDKEVHIASSGAFHLVDLRLVPTLEAALSDSQFIIGTSGRSRSKALPVVSSIAQTARDAPAPITVLFGRESTGLTSPELLQCHALLRLPVSKKFPSLNLSHAVAIVLHQWAMQEQTPPPVKTIAPRELQERWLERLTEKAELNDNAKGQVRRLLQKSEPSEDDMSLLFNLLKPK